MDQTHKLRSQYVGWLNIVLLLIATLVIPLAQPMPIQWMDKVLGFERTALWNIAYVQASLALAIIVVLISVVTLLASIRDAEKIRLSKTLLVTASLGALLVFFWLIIVIMNASTWGTAEARVVDTTPPVLEGVIDRTVEVGEIVLYRQGITAKDDVDERVHIKIDKKSVDLYTPGIYEVIYTAYDTAGNTAVKVSKLSVVPSVPVSDELTKMAESVLAQIIADEMTNKEKLWEIYTWTKAHITYIGYSDKSDWRTGAIQGFKNGSGDCFNYYSVARALLQVGGFEYMPVERVDSSISDHYWLLVKYEGKWYHFDPTPSVRNYPFVGFLRSQSEVESYTQKVNHIIEGYFIYDKEVYPTVEFKPLQ